MKIIIDGYNLFKSIFTVSSLSDAQKERGIRWLRDYQRKKGHVIILVFDAGPDIFPLTESQNGISVVYSGLKQSADEYIQEYIAHEPSSELVLVTSDNELASSVKDSVVIIRSDDFYSVLKNAQMHSKKRKPNKSPIKKLCTDNTSAQLDTLMYESDIEFPSKEEEEDSLKGIDKKAFSKQEKKVWDILKKL